MADREKVIPAFVECLCKSHKYCSECYQQGPGLGFVCRNNVCLEVLEILKEQQKEIEILKAMGLKMPEITELTDKPIYKVDV